MNQVSRAVANRDGSMLAECMNLQLQPAPPVNATLLEGLKRVRKTGCGIACCCWLLQSVQRQCASSAAPEHTCIFVVLCHARAAQPRALDGAKQQQIWSR
jgi:hypothetical protein